VLFPFWERLFLTKTPKEKWIFMLKRRWDDERIGGKYMNVKKTLFMFILFSIINDMISGEI
jgi:hypothetical protein